MVSHFFQKSCRAQFSRRVSEVKFQTLTFTAVKQKCKMSMETHTVSGDTSGLCIYFALFMVKNLFSSFTDSLCSHQIQPLASYLHMFYWKTKLGQQHFQKHKDLLQLVSLDGLSRHYSTTSVPVVSVTREAVCSTVKKAITHAKR